MARKFLEGIPHRYIEGEPAGTDLNLGGMSCASSCKTKRANGAE